LIQHLQNFAKLATEEFLIVDKQQLGNMLVLSDSEFLLSLELQENVSREKWLLKRDGFPAIPMSNPVARKRRQKAVAVARPFDFLFAPRPGVDDEPPQVAHVTIEKA
jgi:hypothetical protein